ncbi:MAG TPA: hypothetical protein VGD74_13245 [Vulgatibacter sp.]
MKRALVCILVAAGCAGPAPVPLEPPATEGEGQSPGIGRLLELELESPGGPVSLRAVTGRVTVVCVVRKGEARVVRACERAAAHFADRVTVVGVDTSGAIDPATVPFRLYGDPEGSQLAEKLDLDPAPKVVATDKRGRVLRVVQPADLDVLEATLRRLVE